MSTSKMIDDRQALIDTYGSYTFPVELPPPKPGSNPVTRITDQMSPNEPVMSFGNDKITLKVRRSQRRKFFGGVGFSIHFIAELSPEVKNAVIRYQFSKIILFEKDLKSKLLTPNIFKLAWRVLILFFTRSRWQIRVDDLVKGRTISSKGILEMLETEEDIKHASKTFANILRAAAWFGGEELIDL